MKDSLGDRMKRYETAAQQVLPMRLPVIIRVDGRAFHSWTREMKHPFDATFINWMNDVALALCKDIQDAVLAYIQSDEISVLLINYNTIEASAWFDNQVQKMVSSAAALASATMTKIAGRLALFDARAFALPRDEVTNYFLWRQNDATRNSLQMLARALYSHKECYGKKQSDLQEMCFASGQNWNSFPTYLKRGRCAVRTPKLEGKEQKVLRSRWVIDSEPPIWTGEGRDYIELLVEEKIDAFWYDGYLD
jgi:tRNA(His) guanylyltransferase